MTQATGTHHFVPDPRNADVLAAGPHPEDGVWASHWYGRVEASTVFECEEDQEPPPLDDSLQAVADACHEGYQAMARFRLRSSR